MTIQTVKQFNQKLNNMQKSNDKLFEDMQEAIIYFVKEYNNALTYNKNGLTKIFEILKNNSKTMYKFLKKYTNLKSISYDFKNFTTDKFITVTTSEGEKKKLYTLTFNDDYNGQKWYETVDEDASETIKQTVLSDKSLKTKLKNLINAMEKENKLTINVDSLKSTLETYITKLEHAIEIAE